MRRILAVLFSGLSAALAAQTPSQTFMSSDGSFEFHYPASLVHCTEQKRPGEDSTTWVPQTSCDAMMSVCDDEGSQGSSTMVCFAFPREEFKAYPAFNAAAFSVAEIKGALTEKECLGGSPDWDIDPRGSGKFVEINHANFKVFEISDAGMSHYLDGEVYRIFHRNMCYQLSIKTATTNPSVFDQPGKEFTGSDQEGVDARLKQALDSFIFLK